MTLHKRQTGLALLTATLLLAALVGLLRRGYLYDNKYTAPPPYGENGVFSFTPEDLSRPLFLVDGWLFSVDGGQERETFIGQYSNFSFVPGHEGPYGRAVYRLELRCPGTHALTLELPEVFGTYTFLIDDVAAATRGSGRLVDFVLQDRAELTLEVENHDRYYSGLTYPPMLGTGAAVGSVSTARTIFYTALLVCALTLAIFSSVLWLSRTGERLYLHFGLLCLAFAVVCLHPFFWYAGVSGAFSCAMVDCARLLMLTQALHLCAINAGWQGRRFYDRGIRPVCLGLCALCLIMVSFIIPRAGGLINLYGTLVDAATVTLWALLCAASVRGLAPAQAADAGILAGGCCALGVAMLTNLLNNNRFEPIRFGWQGEYAGFALVLLFGVWMVRYNRRLVLHHRQLLTKMEDLVQERTAELGTVLEERKAFFSNMAHDLKAPIAAVHNFIALIRDGNLYLDDELRGYIRQIESGNEALRHRVESLSTLNSFDQITAPRERLEVDGLLAAIRDENEPDVGVMGIHFSVGTLGQSTAVYAQREKLMILFENLIYNAIAFTPPGGTISILPRLEGESVIIEVSDTGSGIAAEHLPHIFERFYTTRGQTSEGSGLGLYICKLTAEELGGTITADSIPEHGSTFTIQLPALTVKWPQCQGE